MTFDDEYLQVEQVTAMPRPEQSGGVPIWVSGTLNPRVLERIVRFGAGWVPWGPDAEDIAAGIRRIREVLSDAGRDPERFEVAGGLPTRTDGDGNVDVDATMQEVPALVDAGITDFRIGRLPEDPDAAQEQLTAIVAAFRRAVGRDRE